MATYFGDLKHTSVVGLSVPPAAAIVASANGTAIDMNDGDGNNFMATLSMGVYDVTSGSETYAVKITEADASAGPFTDLVTPCAFTTKTAAGGADGLAYVEDAIGQRSKRWLRAEITIGGVTPSMIPVVTIRERKKIGGTGDGHFSAPDA